MALPLLRDNKDDDIAFVRSCVRSVGRSRVSRKGTDGTNGTGLRVRVDARVGGVTRRDPHSSPRIPRRASGTQNPKYKKSINRLAFSPIDGFYLSRPTTRSVISPFNVFPTRTHACAIRSMDHKNQSMRFRVHAKSNRWFLPFFRAGRECAMMRGEREEDFGCVCALTRQTTDDDEDERARAGIMASGQQGGGWASAPQVRRTDRERIRTKE